MRLAIVSDEPYAVHAHVCAWLTARGHELVRFGSLRTGTEVGWAAAAEEAALAVASGDCDQGIFFCWTGTGISIAANKVAGIRAALCGDPGTAAGARIWNHANILCLSNRTLAPDMADEILTAWFDTVVGTQGDSGVATLAEVEGRHRSHP